MKDIIDYKHEHVLLLRHIKTTWPSMVPDHNTAFASYTGSTSTVRNTRQTGGTALEAATSFAGQSVQSPTGDL